MSARRLRGGPAVWAAGAIALLAAVEAAVAVVAPLRAPNEDDWAAAAAEVRAGFRPGDLIVAAPSWADPILRKYLGDLIPIAAAARMDSARYARVWELSQRGGRSPEAAGARIALEKEHGALTVRRLEREASHVSYDFLEHWADARVTRVSPAAGAALCPRLGERFQCPAPGGGFVAPQLVEVDTQIRRALLAPPIANGTVVLEFANVPLARELAVATGLSNVWSRKYAKGAVELRVLVEGQLLATVTTVNESGWKITRIDTSARAGQRVTVRMEVTSPAPQGREFAIAAEARG